MSSTAQVRSSEPWLLIRKLGYGSLFGLILCTSIGACATGTGAQATGDVDANASTDAGISIKPDARIVPMADASTTDAALPADAGLPDAGDCTLQTVNLLVNPNFDGAAGSWVGSPSEASIVRVPPVTPDSSPNSAWLGGATSTDDVLHQDVAIPADATGLTLSGRIRQDTDEIIHNNDDILRLDITNTSNVVLSALKEWDENDDGGWGTFSYTLADYAGQTIRVRLHANNDSSLASSFFIDTLNLSAMSCQ